MHKSQVGRTVSHPTKINPHTCTLCSQALDTPMLSNGCCHVLAANVQTSYQVKWNNFTCFNIVRSYFLETSRHYTNHTLTLERYDDLSSYKLIPHFNCKDDKYKQLWWCLHCSGWNCGCFWAGGFYLLNTGCPLPVKKTYYVQPSDSNNNQMCKVTVDLGKLSLN